MPEHTLKEMDRLCNMPHGIILVTGPTGSGKTTTLYAALSRIDSSTTNVMTVEDPVEYDLPGISQTPVNAKIDMTFAKALRAILRQDPDVIMIGEIRDLETAQIAVQASLTGHLVLATLHTNDSVSAVTRLVDMGVEPFLLSSSLLGVLAQRLVRRLCPNCKTSTVDEQGPTPTGMRTGATTADTRATLAAQVCMNCSPWTMNCAPWCTMKTRRQKCDSAHRPRA
jgi:general secretion pathway protein E